MGRKSNFIKAVEEEGRHRVVKQAEHLRIYKKPGVQSWDVKNTNAFWNTRLHNAECKECAEAGKLLRQQLAPLLIDVKDKGMVSRVLQLMLAIQGLDDAPRGRKSLARVFDSDSAKALLNGFQFTVGASLKALLLKIPEVNENGISFKNFVALQDLCSKPLATHVELVAGLVYMNPVKGTVHSQYAKPVRIPINNRTRQVELKLRRNEPQLGVGLYVLKINFYRKAFRLSGEGAVAVIEVI
jgi:hypothetical protein